MKKSLEGGETTTEQHDAANPSIALVCNEGGRNLRLQRINPYTDGANVVNKPTDIKLERFEAKLTPNQENDDDALQAQISLALVANEGYRGGMKKSLGAIDIAWLG